MPRVVAASEEHVIIAMNKVHIVSQIRRRLRPVNYQSYLQNTTVKQPFSFTDTTSLFIYLFIYLFNTPCV